MPLLVDEYPEHKNLINFYGECAHVKEIFRLADMYLKEDSLRSKNPIDDYLRPILQESALLNIAKIHDKRKMGAFNNSSLEYYVYQYGIEKSELYVNFLSKNKLFIDAVTSSRKKVIAHSDFSIFEAKATVGGFNDGDEEQYFCDLWLVFELLYQKAGIPVLTKWSDFVKADFNKFIEIINQGSKRK